MTLKDFQKETARIVNDNEAQITESYNKFSAEDNNSKGAMVLYLTKKEVKYYYVSETYNKYMYDKLPPFMIDKIKQNQSDMIYTVCLGIKDYITSFWLKKDIGDTLRNMLDPIIKDISKLKINDTEENENIVLSEFYRAYGTLEKESSNNINFFELSDEDAIAHGSDILIDDIDSGKATPESVMNHIIKFNYKRMKKMVYEDDKMYVPKENMLRNFNEVERFNYRFIGGTLLHELQEVILPSTELSEEDKINWKLDIDNFIKVVNSVESLNYDSTLQNFDHLIGEANRLRESAKNNK